MSLISFVIPVYNAEQYLKQCINSIISHSNNDYEIIIINDCSTDNSMSVIEEYEHLSQVRILNNSKNLGVSACRNKGINYSNGKYIFFVDSDDYILENSLNNIDSIIKSNNNMDLIIINHNKSSDGNLHIESGIYNTNELVNILNDLEYFTGYCWRFIVKKELLIKYNILYPGVKTHEDEDYITHLLCFSKSIYYNNKQVYFHRFNEHGLSMSKDYDSTIACLLIIERLIVLYNEIEISVSQKLFIISRIDLLVKYFIPRLFFRSTTELLIISKKFNVLIDSLLKLELYNYELFNLLNSDVGNKINYLMKSVENNLLDLVSGNSNQDLYVFCVGLHGEAVNQILLKKNIHINGFLDNNIVYDNKIINDVTVFQPVIFKSKSKNMLSNISVIICNQRNEHYKVIYELLVNYHINKNNINRFVF